jgi:calcium-dependent protein kinase
MDLNNDGKLNRDELVTAFKVLYDNIDALKEANLIMDAVDKNLSGAIDFSEYVFAAMDRKKIVEKDRLLRAFMVFD